jgi:hypothetical protein
MAVAQVPEPRLGLMSLAPPSVHTVMPEVVGFLAGPAAALLQLAHPYVGHGVLQHSAVAKDIRLRFHRTFFYVFRIGVRPRAAAPPRADPSRVLSVSGWPPRSVWGHGHGGARLAGGTWDPQPRARHHCERHRHLSRGRIVHGPRPGRTALVCGHCGAQSVSRPCIHVAVVRACSPWIAAGELGCWRRCLMGRCSRAS